jgi:glutaryl-CoA dehydrogenase (non-decarboxylating)
MNAAARGETLLMLNRLTPRQHQAWRGFREFADTAVAPQAQHTDAEQAMPREVVKDLARAGWLSSLLPEEWGGAATDMVTYGLMSEELGRTCSTVRNFVAVADMVSYAIWKWGTSAQRDGWLTGIASGDVVAAFALTEETAGSDIKSVTTEAYPDGSGILLRGGKKWISFGQIADLLLVFAQYEGQHTALLVERDTPGVRIKPITGLLGLRGSMLAEITFENCRLPADSLVGHPGSGLAFVASTALKIGRYSTAWGCVGLAQACLEASSQYAKERRQYDRAIIDHQLVQRMLADMVAGTYAARLLCGAAGAAEDSGDPDAVNQILLAKYFASTTANRVAADAVQIHGAYGIGSDFSVGRLFRDAKVMEIIEGTTQLHQSMLGQWTGRLPFIPP